MTTHEPEFRLTAELPVIVHQEIPGGSFEIFDGTMRVGADPRSPQKSALEVLRCGQEVPTLYLKSVEMGLGSIASGEEAVLVEVAGPNTEQLDSHPDSPVILTAFPVPMEDGQRDKIMYKQVLPDTNERAARVSRLAIANRERLQNSEL